MILAALIEYPGVGLILYETGCGENLEAVSLAFPVDSPGLTAGGVIISRIADAFKPLFPEMGPPHNRDLPSHSLWRGPKAPRGDCQSGIRYQGRQGRYNGPPTPGPRGRTRAFHRHRRAYLRP